VSVSNVAVSDAVSAVFVVVESLPLLPQGPHASGAPVLGPVASVLRSEAVPLVARRAPRAVRTVSGGADHSTGKYVCHASASPPLSKLTREMLLFLTLAMCAQRRKRCRGCGGNVLYLLERCLRLRFATL
jgi:hypothetical protein